MRNQLLCTKLTVPRVRAPSVARPRLIARLDEVLAHANAWQSRLTLLSAPAGYGKTTLLCQWLAGCSCPIAWLSLDEADNDPGLFLSYLVAALQQVEPDLGTAALDALRTSAVTSTTPPLSLELALTLLLNEIASIRDPFLLVLDDYHLIENTRIHEAVSFLLDNQPPQLHLVIATRVDPPLPIARLRAQAQVVEVRVADLYFTTDETGAFLRDVMGLALDGEQVATLERLTEGWIAGLQLAAHSMRERDDVAGFIEAFGGSHRYILDYLTEEVLERQDPAVQTFLLKTAILGRLSAPLCAVVTGRADSQQILERLDAANLFIIPLDDERRWYRYHHLFADLLRQRLQRKSDDLLPELHRQAGAWYEAHDLLPEAVKHSLLAEDFERVARLLQQNGWTMLVRGEMSTLLRWLDALPHDVVDAQPKLGILNAWALAFTGQWERVERTLETIDRCRVPGEVAAVRAYVAAVQGDVARTRELAQLALGQLPQGDRSLRALVNFCIGITYFSSGRPAAAAQALSEVIRLARAADQLHLTMTATAHLGHVREMQGLLHQALKTHRDALRLAPRSGERPVPFSGIACVGIAEVLYEWNDLDGARRYASEGIRLTQLGGFVSYMLAGYARLVQVNQARGDVVQAQEILQGANRLAQKHNYRYMQGVFAELQTRLWIAQGQLQEAWRWAQAHRLRPDDEPDLAREVEQMAVARILIARAATRGGSEAKELDEALALLARLLDAAEQAGRSGSAIKIQALEAVAFHLQGAAEPTLSILQRALMLAEPEGYVRTFVDEGEPMACLLRKALAEGSVPDYVARLLHAFDKNAYPLPATADVLVEPLSERELEVLRLIVAGLSNREIAQELVIAVSTVKSHINNIYGKLGVKSRTQAVARAHALVLL